MKLLLMPDRIRPPVRVVGVSDSSGGISAPAGLPLLQVLQWKLDGNRMCDFKGAVDVVNHASTIDMVKNAAKRGDILFDGTPVNLQTGGVGLESCRYAATNGIHIVLANKAPLVLAYDELMATAAQEPSCCIEFSATVCGGLPVVNVGRRDLLCGQMDCVKGIFNSTSNFILTSMAKGQEPAEALRIAQAAGIAETDPSLDLEGYDTANKLVIISNSVLRIPARLADIDITGISGISHRDINEAACVGEVYRLIGTAQRYDSISEASCATAVPCPDPQRGCYVLSVKPARVKANSFLGGCVDSDMCVVFRSEEFETISMKTDETGVYPTSCAMLRDCFAISRSVCAL